MGGRGGGEGAGGVIVVRVYEVRTQRNHIPGLQKSVIEIPVIVRVL